MLCSLKYEGNYIVIGQCESLDLKIHITSEKAGKKRETNKLFLDNLIRPKFAYDTFNSHT